MHLQAKHPETADEADLLIFQNADHHSQSLMRHTLSALIMADLNVTIKDIKSVTLAAAIFLDPEQAHELGCSFQIFSQALAIRFGIDRLNHIDRYITGFF